MRGWVEVGAGRALGSRVQKEEKLWRLLQSHLLQETGGILCLFLAGKVDPSPAPVGFHHRGSWEEGTRGHSQGLASRGALRARQNICKNKTTKPPRQGLCHWSHQSPVITSLSPGLESTEWPCQADKGPGAMAQVTSQDQSPFRAPSTSVFAFLPRALKKK